MATLTSANSQFTLNVPGVFPGPITLQGYATDDAFGTEEVSPVEAKIGVDGRKSSGFTPYLVRQTIHLQADSQSVILFDQWLGALQAAGDDLVASASIWSPSLNKVWDCQNGSLTKAKTVPDAKKIFEAQTYEITWESVQVSAL